MKCKLNALTVVALILMMTMLSLSTLTPTSAQEQTVQGPYPGKTQYPWVTTQHDFNRTSYTESPAPKTNHLLWKVDLFSYDQAWASSPSVKDGMVFVSLRSSMGAFDAETGKKIWETALPHYAMDERMSGFTVVDGKIFVSIGYYTFCIDEFKGEILANFNHTPYLRPDWVANMLKYPTERVGRVGAPTYVDNPYPTKDWIYVATREGTLYALQYDYGRFTLKWYFKDQHFNVTVPGTNNGMLLNSPIVAAGRVYIGSEDKYLYALNATTGKQLWNFTWGGKIYYGPTYVDGKLYVGAYNADFYCLNATNGAVMWNKSWPLGGGSWLGPAAAYGMLYIGTTKGMDLYALNQTTGATVWNYTYPTSMYPYGAPSVADGMVFQSTGGYANCTLYAFDAMTGELIWQYYLGPGYGYTANPAIADGRLYIQNDGGGILYSFGKGPTKTMLSVVSSSMTNGSKALITGSVLDQSPASLNYPIANASVTLSYASMGGNYTRIATITTASDGAFRYEWTLPEPGFYDIMTEWNGDQSYLGSNATVLLDVDVEPPPYPQPPSTEEIAQEVANAFIITDMVIAAIAVITLFLVVYLIAKVRKFTQK